MGSRLTFGSRLRQVNVSASTSTVALVRSSTADGWSAPGKPRAAGRHQGVDSWAVPPSMARRYGCSEFGPLTYATYESHVKNYIEPGIGALRLDHLRVADVQAWLNRL